MKVHEIFASDVTRDIPPVIYFHEQEPEKLQSEVEEYIITGGYEENDPRRKRISDGIHEQYVRLLRSLKGELEKTGGADLPACWISGFYGSGKSSFAKLLGLSLDQRQLPNGKTLAEALLNRDDSPRRNEFREAWQGVISQIDPLAVVFDIGAVARDDEHIHSAVKRQLAHRLGYCPESHHVAEYELKLEIDGRWDEFLSLAEETLGYSWDEAKAEQLAEDNFSEVMHAMFPSRYTEPFTWLDVCTGTTSGASSVDETVKAMESMMKFRAEGKTLFLVVDEVSQYIHQNDNRMLKLQSFVSALGERLKGRVWLLATGQQKLEEDLEGSNLSKLKDRFPPRLRAHLAPTNIRDVVHRRLLKKLPDQEKSLEELFDKHKSDLKLYGYRCDDIGARDFVEVYPMLPGHVDLLMQITSNLRARSSRMKGDDHAIRGLLQLLGEIFREKDLGEAELGSLVTLDQIYDVQYTALDADVQNTMARLQADEEMSKDDIAFKAAKAVALLELIQEQDATTPELVARCLYPKLGQGSEVEKYRDALQRLYDAGFLSFSEKTGYKIQSSAGQEWARERDAYSVKGSDLGAVVQEKLRELIGQANRPRFKGSAFPVAAFYSDSRGAREERLQNPKDPAVVTYHFHYETNAEEREEEKWRRESGLDAQKEAILWVCGNPGVLDSKARELQRSRHMVSRYQPRLQSLPEGRKRLLFEEQNRRDHLEKELLDLVGSVFLEGALYFQSRRLDIDRHGHSFPGVLAGAGEEVLPKLFEHFVDLRITEGELNQLLADSLSGVNHKFLDDGLGLFKLDAGKYIPSCQGEIVNRIRQKVDERGGMSGSELLAFFGGPPCGYPADVVKACVVGLLRASMVRIRTSRGVGVTSVKDPDVQDLFRGDKEFKKADILPGEMVVSARMRTAIRKFFNKVLDVDFELDMDHIADSAFQHFPKVREQLSELQGRLNQLTSRPDLPKALDRLPDALEKCLRSRLVEETVIAVHKNLDNLRDGITELRILLGDLTETTLAELKRAQRVQRVELDQLLQLGGDTALSEAEYAIKQQLDDPRPWTGIGSIEKQIEFVGKTYQEKRAELLNQHETLANKLSDSVKTRDGFARLNDQQSSTVLRPIRDALCDTTAEATHPTLSFLRDSVPARLKEAAEESNRKLDALLAEMDKVQVVQVKTGLSGRELNSEKDVEILLNELRERLMQQLKNDVRIRLI